MAFLQALSALKENTESPTSAASAPYRSRAPTQLTINQAEDEASCYRQGELVAEPASTSVASVDATKKKNRECFDVLALAAVRSRMPVAR